VDRVVLVGGSYIGCEVAASLTATGTECAIVMMEDVVLSRNFGEDAGRYFQGILEEKGIEVHPGETLAAFEGDDHASAVVTESGKTVKGDLVVVGAGVKPDTMLAEKAGLEIDEERGGILCDETLQTSVEGIYAAGDVCSYESKIHGRRLRVEHWDVAMQQGLHAGKVMAGEAEPYEVVPYFFSDLADWASLEYVGPAEDWEEEVWRGTADSCEFAVFYLKGGKVAGCLSVERSEDLQVARELLEKGVDVSGKKEQLADTGSDLSSLT
jgi:3-phenylpropionate/trans-cinnamate dioxygenase ferredoxin reductase subunit